MASLANMTVCSCKLRPAAYSPLNNWHFRRTAKKPKMTATAKEDDKGPVSLKGHVHTAAMGTQANDCTRMTKAIAECVGRVHVNNMQQLAQSGKESTPTEPAHPDGTNGTNKDKAIWGEQHDLFLKQEVQCKDQKAKAFTIVFGQCNKAMKNQLEANSSSTLIELTTDVAKLLQLMRGVACDAKNLKYPTTHAVKALRSLMTA